MGTITTGVGLISGIDTASIIDQLIALEALGKIPIQNRITSLQNKQLALLDINARLLNLKTASASFRIDSIFKSALASSSNEEVMTATAGKLAQPGNFSFIVKQLVTSSQKLSQGFVDKNTTPLGLTTISFEFGNGLVAPDTDLIDLNGGAGGFQIKQSRVDIKQCKLLVLQRGDAILDRNLAQSFQGNQLINN